MEELTVLKVGGNVLDNPAILQGLINTFAVMENKKILIHGGGKIANVLMKELGIEPKMVDGRRITDEKTLEIVTMVYAGLINKNLVSQLQSRNCNAMGLTGADGNTIPAYRRPVKTVDYGFVGDINTDKINSVAIQGLLNQGITPVFAPITHDGKGSLLNTNADTIASSVAIAMAKSFRVRLMYCFEKKGVLYDSENEDAVIEQLTEKSYAEFKEKGTIHSGMIPKLDNAFAALKSGVSEIIICGPQTFDPECPNKGTSIVI